MLTPFVLPNLQICIVGEKINKWISNFASLFVLPEQRSGGNVEQRGIGLDQPGVLKLFNISESGVSVTEDTALGISSLWRAVDLMASLIATMPKTLYLKDKGLIEEANTHPSSILIKYLIDDEYTPFDFWYSMMANAYLKGGGGAEIIRDERTGRPKRLRLMRHGCTPYKLSKNDPLTYYDNEDGQMYHPDDVLFIPGLLVTDGAKARPILTAFRDTFGKELSADLLENTYLKSGPFAGGVYTYTGKLTDVGKQQITSTFEKKHGGVAKAGKIIPIGNAEKFTQLRPNSFADAQFLDLRTMRVEDVARMFGLPVPLLMSLDKPSYNSLEQLFKQFLITTLDPRVTRIDQELNRKLLFRRELGTYYFESEVDEMMWTTANERAEYWWKQFQMGAITTNEIREYQNRNPVEGGDKPLVQLQLAPLEQIAKQVLQQDEINRKKRSRKKETNPKQTELFENQISDNEPESKPA